MKRFFATLVIFALSICLLSCSQNRTYEDGYADGYSDAESEMLYRMEEELLDEYDIGYEDGYYEGIADAQHDIANRMEDELWDIGWDIKTEYGIHPGEAIEILANYAYVPDEVGETELLNAIQAIYHYYYDSQEIIREIERG